MKELNSSIEKLLRHLTEASGCVELLKLHRAWKTVVGPIVSARAYVYKYDRGTVFIGAVSSSWIQELVLRKTEWITRLRELSGVPVNEILFFPKEKPNGAHRAVNTRRQPR
jgi:hypothetical protein